MRALTEKVWEVEAEVLLHRSGLLCKIYAEEMNQKGVSRERIRQIEERALAKIFINSQNLLNAWYDEISKIATLAIIQLKLVIFIIWIADLMI